MIKRIFGFTLSIVLFCICICTQAAEFPYDMIYNKSIQRNAEYVYMEKLSNGNILLAGREPSSAYVSNVIFTVIDPNGEVISTKSVTGNTPAGGSARFSHCSIFKYKDKYVISGQTSTYTYRKVMVIDSNFNPLWEYTVSGGDTSYLYTCAYNDMIYSIYKISGDYTNTYNIESFNMDGSKKTYITQMVPPSGSTFVVQKAMLMNDASIVVSGPMLKNGNKISLITMKYSLDGKKVWEHEATLNYQSTSLSGPPVSIEMILLKSGDIAILQRENNPNVSTYSQSVFIYSQSGTLLRTIPLANQYKLFNLAELEDNTLLLIGSRDNTQELYLENISLDGNVNYTKPYVTNLYPTYYRALVDGGNIYLTSYLAMSYSNIAYNLLVKLSLKPPTIALDTTTPKIGDNTPFSLNLNFNIYGNVIRSLKISDNSNNQYYNSGLLNNVNLNANEGDTTVKAQLIGDNGTVMATSNTVTINKRNLLGNIISVIPQQSASKNMVILDDVDRYYENNIVNQGIVAEIKKRISGIFIINNDVSPVLTPLLGI